MWETVEQYVAKNGGKVSITCESFGIFYYTCKIHRAYIKKLPVQVSGQSAEVAFALAKMLVEEVETLEKDLGDILHVDADTPGINVWRDGYALLPVTDDPKDQRRVSYKTIGTGEYVITSVQIRDKRGYLVLKEPQDVSELKDHFAVNDYTRSHFEKDEIEEEKKFLAEGEELYIFDDISYLCGRAGFAVVKGDKVIRRKTIIIS